MEYTPSSHCRHQKDEWECLKVKMSVTSRIHKVHHLVGLKLQLQGSRLCSLICAILAQSQYPHSVGGGSRHDSHSRNRWAAENLCRRYLVFQDVHATPNCDFFHLAGIMGLELRRLVVFQRGAAGGPRQQYKNRNSEGADLSQAAP